MSYLHGRLYYTGEIRLVTVPLKIIVLAVQPLTQIMQTTQPSGANTWYRFY